METEIIWTDCYCSLSLSLLLTYGRRHYLLLLYKLQCISTGGHRLMQAQNTASQNPVNSYKVFLAS